MPTINLNRLKKTNPQGFNDLWRHLKDQHPEIAEELKRPFYKDMMKKYGGTFSLELPTCCAMEVKREGMGQPEPQKPLDPKEMGRRLASHFGPNSKLSKT